MNLNVILAEDGTSQVFFSIFGIEHPTGDTKSVLNHFHSPGAGWYVVAVALVLRFISMIPLMRYKDQAMVTKPKGFRL